MSAVLIYTSDVWICATVGFSSTAPGNKTSVDSFPVSDIVIIYASLCHDVDL